MVVERVAQVLGVGSASGDKAKGKEDPHSHRDKFVEDILN